MGDDFLCIFRCKIYVNSLMQLEFPLQNRYYRKEYKEGSL